MPVSVVGVTEDACASCGGVTLAWPTGWQAGDVIVGCVMTKNATTDTTPTDFTDIAMSRSGTSTTTDIRVEMFYRIAQSGDPGSTAITFGEDGVAAFVCLRDVDTSSPILDFDTSQNTGGSNPLGPVDVVNGGMLIACWGFRGDIGVLDQLQDMDLRWDDEVGSAILRQFSGFTQEVEADGDSGSLTLGEYGSSDNAGIVASFNGAPEVEATLVGGGAFSLERATLAHVIVAPDGRACYPIIGNWEFIEQASLGQIGGGGRIGQAFYQAHRDVLVPGAEWWTIIRETGEVRTWGILKGSPGGRGAVELSCYGAAGLALARAGRWFYAGFGTDYWQADEVKGHAKAPKTALAAAMDGAGNVNVGIHRWRVTFVTADGETAMGPRFELDVTASAKQVALTDIPKGPGFVTARKVYRTEAGGSTYKLLTTINDNTTTSYTDNTADAGLGATAPTGFEANEIEVTVKKGAIVWNVPRGADVADGQLSSVSASLPGDEQFTAIQIDIDKTRDTTGFVLRVEAADDKDSAMSLISSLSLDDDGPHRSLVALTGDRQMVRLVLKKSGTGTNLDALKVTVSGIELYGRANDEDFDTDDIVRDVLGEINIDDDEVRPSGSEALPADYPNATAADVLELQAIMSGRPIILRKDGLRTIGEFHDYDSTIWTLIDPEAIDDLDDLPLYNHVVATVREDDGEVLDEVEAFAEVTELDRRVTLSIALNSPGTRNVANNLVDSLIEVVSKPRYAGTIATRRFGDANGLHWHAYYARVGDSIRHPDKGILNIDEVQLNDTLPVFVIRDPIVALIQRFNARQERKLALRLR